MIEMKNKPLSVILEDARVNLTMSFDKVISEAKLPAYLVEGILIEILADLRRQKSMELIEDMKNAIEKENKEGVSTDKAMGKGKQDVKVGEPDGRSK